jgi:ATP adenylyltransferase
VRRLWAPWRVEYIRKSAQKGCIFCRAWRSESDSEHYVVHRSGGAFAMLNAYPYTSGHVMVAHRRHVGDLARLSTAELAELMEETQLAVRALRRAIKPQGFNIGVNLGRIAGAGVEDHLHIHVVPRWAGDTNFMPVLGDVRVMPEALERTCEMLTRAFRALKPRRK